MIFGLLCFGFGFDSASGGVSDCTKMGSSGHITSITMDPPAPKSGDYATFYIDYTLDKTVTSGLVTYTASFNGFPLKPTTEDLCADLKPTTTPCPIEMGLVHFEGIVQIGDGTTHGTLAATTTWADQDGQEIVCWGFAVRI